MTTPITHPGVAQVFADYPSAVGPALWDLRDLILKTAAATPGVGPLEETLKWGEPAYLTAQSKSGSTIRLRYQPKHPTQYALMFNCQTTLVETFRTLFPRELRLEGQRAVLFDAAQPFPTQTVAFCIAAALTYHRKNQH